MTTQFELNHPHGCHLSLVHSAICALEILKSALTLSISNWPAGDIVYETVNAAVVALVAVSHLSVRLVCLLYRQ